MRRKSDKVKKLQGNFRQDRGGVVVEVEGELPIPECPSWLDEVGKQTWDRVTAITDKVDLTLDVETLATFCDCYSHLIKCSQVLRIDGYTIISDGLQKKINPAVNALRELQKTLIEAGKQLCLSVDARGKAGIAFKEKEHDALDEFLRTGRANNERGNK
jgi:P27 family predicted phage terminase small subunit